MKKKTRRWSRIGETLTQQNVEHLQKLAAQSGAFEEDSLDESEDGMLEEVNYRQMHSDESGSRFRRTGSERLRDGAKAFLKRMESLKSRKRKPHHHQYQPRQQNPIVISGPQVVDIKSMHQKMKDMNCIDVSPTESNTAVAITVSSPFGDDSSSYCSDGSQGGGPSVSPEPSQKSKISFRAKKLLQRSKDPRDDTGALSDSECQQSSWKHRYFKDANSNDTKVLVENLGKDYRLTEMSGCSRAEIRRDACPDVSGDLPTSSSRDSDQDEDSAAAAVRQKGAHSVVRWHSFQRGSLCTEPLETLCPRAMASMSCGQLLVLRKLALLKLTAYMERYCPTHRTGWNWELPKFIRKIKTPDYKDKTVFGVPLLLSVQRTGQALPKCIQIALRWLKINALDQVGIFRKSGVRSRIQNLKEMTETLTDNVNFEGYSVFDVADLVKQYFRELPEPLLTNKLSETFIAIFQHVPLDIRPDAVQCILLLLPDEHREALESLLDFLNHVASNSLYNQMNASNLAVCLAPSLFHLSSNNNQNSGNNRSNSVSPRRRKIQGTPDHRELMENKAAHDCLLHLIKTHRQLFMISSDMLSQCHFSYMEESVPVSLEKLGSELKQDWKGYMDACITALLKEGREKTRGWESINNAADPQVEIAFKKVGDGHPLRLWRVSTEVEAPPEELLRRVLRERHIWDPHLLKSRLIAKLDTNAEVFQYATGNMSPLPARDYSVVRCWQTEHPRRACVAVETSVEHPDAPVMFGGTRGVVLASRYLIEHCGSGKSRIMHLSRIDTKGRTPEWYNKSYGHIVALHLTKIRNSFKHTTIGPESKV